MNTPVLLIAFNRSDTLLQVFEKVRQAQPPVLYISVDGPRSGNQNDINGTEEVHKVADLVDWPCELHTRFLKENLGCGFGPATAISWAFETCERLIILEDDCVPELSFFTFCDEMLERYSDDLRVGMITGWSPLQKTKYFGEYSYLFTILGNSLGWATWKSRWIHFDMDMKDCSYFLSEHHDVIGNNILSRYYNAHFRKRLLNINEEKKHSWDSQWFYTRYKNSFLTIVPIHNQIKYIGFESGTHIPASVRHLLIPSSELPVTIGHPRFVLHNRKYSEAIFWKNQRRKYGVQNVISHLKIIFKKIINK